MKEMRKEGKEGGNGLENVENGGGGRLTRWRWKGKECVSW